jgi:hypothetical protein
MFTRLALAAAAGVALLGVACSDAPSYKTNKADDDYDLEYMLLRNADLPVGMTERVASTFGIDEWADITGEDDPEARKDVLDKTGWKKGTVALYTPDDVSEELGRTIRLTSQSTLYKDVGAARKAMSDPTAACGTLNSGAAAQPTDFEVPRIGEESIGFFTEGYLPLDDSGQLAAKSVDTTICFRTGRIVHAVVQTGLNGTQDIALAMRLAQRQLVRAERTLDGHPDDKEVPDPGDQGG